MPSVKISFYYEVFNNSKDLLNTGEVVLVFVDKNTMKPCAAPQFVLKRLEGQIKKRTELL